MIRQLVPLLLVAGAGGTAYIFVPSMPTEQAMTLQLDDATSVTAVEAAWSRPSETTEAEALQGGTWRFVSGQAPHVIEMPVRLSRGRYALDLTVERGLRRTSSRQMITLGEAERTVVRVR